MRGYSVLGERGKYRVLGNKRGYMYFILCRWNGSKRRGGKWLLEEEVRNRGTRKLMERV